MENKQKHASCNNLLFIKTLGSGYNAKVKLAYDKKSGKHMAIKIIKNIDRNNLKTLQNELSIMLKLKHPHILELNDFQQNQDYKKKNGKIKKITYIMIELADGGELFDYVANTGNFSYVVARSYFKQLIETLQFCHDKNIAHRDLKPENLLFDKEFRLKVADWGFATLFKDQKNTTILGTESYMAPEINMKQPYNANEVDLFAAGTPPFSKATLKDPYYNLIAKGKIDKFWQQHLKFQKDKKFFTTEFKDLLSQMFQLNPIKRLTIQQIQSHPWYNQTTVEQEKLTKEFSQRKQIVDQEIEMERKKKQLEKQLLQNNNGMRAIGGFRSINTDYQQKFDQIETNFDLKRQRSLIDKNDFITQKQVGTVFSSIDSQELFKCLILGLLEVNVKQENIILKDSRYKIEFFIQDEFENIIIQAEISQYDNLVNQITFMRKKGNIINYYGYIKNIQEIIYKLKQQM